MEVDYKAIGQRIKIARIKKGVTQETVADLIDIHFQRCGIFHKVKGQKK